jgi:hypothetical protein
MLHTIRNTKLPCLEFDPQIFGIAGQMLYTIKLSRFYDFIPLTNKLVHGVRLKRESRNLDSLMVEQGPLEHWLDFSLFV